MSLKKTVVILVKTAGEGKERAKKKQQVETGGCRQIL